MFFDTCQRLIFLLFVAIVLSAPWFFGGALPLHQAVMAAGLCVALWLCLAGYFRRDQRATLGWPLWLMLSWLVLGGLQLIPLPAALHETIAARSYEWWHEFSGSGSSTAAATATEVMPAPFPLSLYPAGTRANLALFGIPTAALAITLWRFRQLNDVAWLLGMVAANGALFAIFGIAQKFTSPDKLFGMVALEDGGVPFAAFVNRNHAAAYLNLCLACALGFLIWVRERPKVGGLFDSLDRGTQLLLAFVLAAACGAGVVLSLSRGAAVASCGGAIALLVLAPRVREDAGYRNTILVAVGMGLMVAFWLGGGAELGARFQDLTEQSQATRGRWEHWKDASHAIPDFWQTGSGIGTYRYVYQTYEHRYVDGWFYHAENQYLEAMIETGLPGLVLLLAMIGLGLWRLVRGLHITHSPLGYGLGVACTFGLVTTLIHAAMDFNLVMPANAILVAVLGGLGYNLALQTRREPQRGVVTILAGGVLPLLLTCTWLCWSAVELTRIEKLDRALRSVGELTTESDFDPDWARRTATFIHQQLDVRRDDSEAQIRFAEFLLAAHRSEVFHQLQGAGGAGNDTESLWRIADIVSLHEKFHTHAPHDEFVEALRENPAFSSFLLPAYQSLCLAVRHGPLIERAHTLLAKISFAFEPAEQELERARLSLRLRGYQPSTLFQLGLLDMTAGREELGLERWRQCLAMTRKYDRAIVSVCVSRLTMANFVAKILPQSPLRAVAIAERVWGDANGITSQQAVLADAIEALDTTALSEAERSYVAATIQRLRGQLDKARQYYLVAVELEPAQAGWRFELAKVMAEQDAIAEALEQAAICAQLDPGNRLVSAFLEQLNLRVSGIR